MYIQDLDEETPELKRKNLSELKNPTKKIFSDQFVVHPIPTFSIPTKRIKYIHNTLKYSLGSCPETIEELYSQIKHSLDVTEPIKLSYKDKENDKITLTTTENYQEALSTVSVLVLQVSSKSQVYERSTSADPIFSIRKCVESLKAVFSIVIGGRIVGIGTVINTRLALTTSKVLPSFEIAKSAFALFENSSFQFDFNPDEVFLSIDDLLILSFLAPFSLIDITPVTIDGHIVVRDNDTIYTLNQPICEDFKNSIKKLFVQNALGDRVYYDSNTACGPSGSPVFNAE